MNKYEQLFATQQRLLRIGAIIGPDYATAFLKEVDAAIEQAWQAAEARRKADNARRGLT